jgi:HTH-type transcriptional regulator, sugar sensing transcriptional regulator
MIDPQSLTLLGLTVYEASAYLALLGRPELSPAEVAAQARIPRQRVYDVLASLAAKGLCLVARDSTPKAWLAVNPATALNLLAQERAQALDRERQEARSLAERLAAELAPVFASGRGQNDPLAYVEVLRGPARIAHRALALAQAATRSVNSCIKTPLILSGDQNQAFMSVPLARGLAYRALCETQAMDDPALRSLLDRFRGSGLDLRLTPALPLKMQAFDDEAVLVSMQDPAGGQPSFTAVTVHNRGLTAMLNLAFEGLWAQAQPCRG